MGGRARRPAFEGSRRDLVLPLTSPQNGWEE